MRARLAAVALLTLVCLAIALRGADVVAIRDALAGFAWWRAPIVLACYGASLLTRNERYRRLLATEISFGALLPITGAGTLAINVVPLRMGELVRPYLLSRRGVPLAEALTAVAAERMLDVVALLVLILAAALVGGPTITVAGIDVFAVGRHTALVTIALFLVAISASRLFGARVVAALTTPAPRLARALTTVLDAIARGLAAIRTGRPGTAVVIACTLGSWLASLVACGVTMGGFAELHPSLGAVLVNWTATITAVVALPTPGFVGGFEAGSAGSLVALGADADVARSFALLLHVLQLAFTVAFGLVCFAILGVTVRDAVHESRSISAAPIE